ncbi:hypothetical protein T069G_06917 [Trichoderma breve]|uniref:Histidine kinase group protein n=1 Tax=Trichoderma breve TaxID=2034170 RepID=A0A9W9E5Y5_9HYPO|nr:hypothetical protein T069G_06917 [Trichoderma breve]KAJ4858650.1 hypothetical protein T069G_06917 [Trichoderma breve]
MAKKKVRQTLGEEASLDSGSASQPSVPSATAQASQASSSSGPKPRSRIPHAAPTTAISPSLVICRNKHWRHISAYHGPWLQMPFELLETLANINYNTPAPRPIDAASFFDLVKVRRLVDEATNLAVRAASDIASPTLTNVNGGFPSISSAMGSHGLGAPPVHGGKLSRERKFRMREQASQKLGRAYRLDEIACSVATMQGASPLEDVGSLVLQRSPKDSDAKYVHFFHEKIPSRKMAESTSLQPLTDIIEDRPTEPEVLRTRATVKIFKEDFDGAIFDLTHALSISQFVRRSHGPNQEEMQVGETQRTARRRPHDIILSEKDQPSSFEAQLYFQRASVEADDGDAGAEASGKNSPEPNKEGARKQAESRKLVKTFAKRAIKDFLSFISHFDYSPNLPAKAAKEFNDRVNLVAHGMRSSRAIDSSSWTESHTVYPLSDLFRSVPPTDLPPYPSQAVCVTYHPLLADALHSLLLAHCLAQTSTKEIQRHAYMVARLIRLADGYPIFQANRSPARADWAEVIHRTENWLSLSSSWDTLCSPAPLPIYDDEPCCGHHTCIHSHNQAQTAVISAGRAASAAAALINGMSSDAAGEEEKRRRELIREQAILDALDDERVTDEASFRAAIEAHEKRAQRNDAVISGKPSNGTATTPKPSPGTSISPNGPDALNGTNGTDKPMHVWVAEDLKEDATDTDITSRRWSADDGRDYPLMTDRASAIARWVQEAPAVTGTAKRKKRTKKTGAAGEGANTRVDEAGEGLEKLEI